MQHIPNLERDSQKSYQLLRYMRGTYTSRTRALDRARLKMKQDALAYGVHCSFGSFPLNP
jgi:hypothetical protein